MYRFAPSPTGDMNISNLRVALFNYICAIQANDTLVVRIEDTDKKRNIEGKDQDILDMLDLFGIGYTQLYYQSNNFKYHLQFASTLLDKKRAFICFCSEEELEAKKEKAKAEGKTYYYDETCEYLCNDYILETHKPFVIRIKKPESIMTFEDQIKGHTSFEPDTIDSFVIMSADKYPTSDFASACDDMLQGITVIIDEEENLLSTPRQELIRRSLGYDESIHYAHLPTVSNANDIPSVKCLLDEGFMPEAILNYLILLGNHTPTEIFTVNEAMQWFDIKNISKSPVSFDLDKLRFINREHIKRLSDMELSKRMGYACDSIGKLAKLYTQEVSTSYEIKQKIDLVFAPKNLHGEFEKELQLLKNLIQDAPYLQTFESFKAYLLEKSELEGKAFLNPLRFLLTGSDDGPDLALIYPFIKNYLKEIVR